MSSNGDSLLFGPREIALPMGLRCMIGIAPEGINGPEVDDDLGVTAWLYLPVNGRGELLVEELRFGKRLALMCLEEETEDEKYTGKLWGDLFKIGDTNWRRQGVVQYGRTWKDAIDKAEALCLAEVERLRVALQLREDALNSEGAELTAAYHLCQKAGQ